jgi:hypothetical protein
VTGSEAQGSLEQFWEGALAAFKRDIESLGLNTPSAPGLVDP